MLALTSGPTWRDGASQTAGPASRSARLVPLAVTVVWASWTVRNWGR